ncbi:hypothetical protein SEA_BUDSKI_64 [Gordonia phage Budski]|nr:hypothetical protein SEA_BUDSKI_64 [Gordonia phage Budski]
MTDKHLWEYDHPYYCEEGNYLASPDRHSHLDVWEQHGSWQSFIDAWGPTDPDLNLVFRWDWHAWHIEYPDDYPDGTEKHELSIYFMLQRKAFNKSVTVSVTADDEPHVRAWLTQRAQTIVSIWEPLIGGAS